MENLQDRQTVDISPSERLRVHMDEEEVGIEGKHEVEKVDFKEEEEEPDNLGGDVVRTAVETEGADYLETIANNCLETEDLHDCHKTENENEEEWSSVDTSNSPSNSMDTSNSHSVNISNSPSMDISNSLFVDISNFPFADTSTSPDISNSSGGSHSAGTLCCP